MYGGSTIGSEESWEREASFATLSIITNVQYLIVCYFRIVVKNSEKCCKYGATVISAVNSSLVADQTRIPR